ncbi:MAG TPA: EamA family transporter [Thermodesulfobacteriota bacterium]|nr:EamA family transporter [Deltaproteobacteria bacterium]HNU72624.1 EamA family transporter [Thermodesulfobacteriota bacterium]HQO77020.1 EamA family transporter [Thermodesulfobacteriota bacterium]
MTYQVLGFTLMAVIFWGVTPVVEKLGFIRAGSDVDPFVALSIRSLAVFVGLIVLIVGTGKWQLLSETRPVTVLFFAASGILAGLLGTWAYLTAIKSGNASHVVPLSATYPLVTVLLSCMVLKEDVTLGKLLGTVCVIMGVWLLK